MSLRWSTPRRHLCETFSHLLEVESAMAEPFGNRDQGGGGKRPAHTIEGTATEISIEPTPEAEARAGSEAHPGGSEPEHPVEGGGEAKDETGAPRRTSLSGLKSFMTHLAAGLLGGLIGVIGLAFAWGALDLGRENGPSPNVAALEERIAKLEAAPAPDSAKIAAFEGRIAALEAGTNQMPAELTKLESRVAQLESSLKTLAETASEGGSVASAAAVAQQIAEAEQRLNEKLAAALAESGGASAATLDQLQREIAELKAKFGALADAELGTGPDMGPELNALSDRIAKLEATVPDLAGALGKEARSAALAIAFANLRAAVSDGRPYAAELDTIGALAPTLGDLGVLPAYAEKGIPTVPELTRVFALARDSALAVAAPPRGDSFLDAVWASAQSLVKIKRIDETQAGEGPSAVLAKAKTALDNGDLAGAVQEVKTLDGAARDAFSAWLAEAHARLGAEETLGRLEGLLLVSMSGGQAPQPEAP
jgi:hypothetical protein